MKTMLERYRAAERASGPTYASLLRNRHVIPHWTGDGDRFWYARTGTDGAAEYVLVDPETTTRTPLPARPDEATPEAKAVSDVLSSPDGRLMLFRRGHDIWLRNPESGAKRPLTNDGEPHFAWGTLVDNSMIHIPLKKSGRQLPPLYTGFSPSGAYVFTARMDERDYREWPFVEFLPETEPVPVLHKIRVRLGDNRAENNHELAVIHVASGRTTKISLTAALATCLIMNGTEAVSWSDDEKKIYLFAHDTGQKTAQLLEFDVENGACRVAVSETAEPLYEANTFLYSLPLIRVLPKTREVIWFSQRDGWGHLYLYDLETGACRNQITTGEIVVRDLLHIDLEARTILFLAGCGTRMHNPYWRKLYKASLDGGDQQLLTPEPMDHEIPAPAPQFFSIVFPESNPVTSPISPSGRYVIDAMSTIDTPPRIVLRRCDGAEPGAICMDLEVTDASAAYEAGFRPPQPFSVKADDGSTDLWGVICLPEDVGTGETVPVVDMMYAGFQMVCTPAAFLSPRDMTWLSVLQGIGFAELGMAAVVMDGRGTPGRDCTFRQWTQGKPALPRGLEDHVTAIKALKDRHPMLDLARVGVTGRSYGGYNSVRAMLMFPDFFKVCVSIAGVHVPERGSWGWHVGADDVDPKALAALGNCHMADRLAGKLLILFGNLDENATPDHSLALVRALMEAGKRFDMKLWPDTNHYFRSPYAQMVIWDYFVEHLLGEAPPADYLPGVAASPSIGGV